MQQQVTSLQWYPSSWTGLTNPKQVVTSMGMETYMFGEPTVGSPGIYRLCWGHDAAGALGSEAYRIDL